ncbi:hypothetical protein OPV22_024439 [Ensete ventricosum]|uniref:Uncharacterized protein n=1 Tax=Ensete ventricosum TaxID=4639 RepID=A0AAV8P8M7_ENSVE|nr:hypothetical protein OPV22_024439 [Ensete ventricosum]
MTGERECDFRVKGLNVPLVDSPLRCRVCSSFPPFILKVSSSSSRGLILETKVGPFPFLSSARVRVFIRI